MKIGIIGTGAVGAATALSCVLTGAAREIVLVNRSHEKAEGMATDLRYGPSFGARVDITDGDYSDLAGSALLILTAGVNEKSGGATDRNDPAGRLRLLESNVQVFRNVVPQMVEAAADTPILVLTDPPDPLVEVARRLAGHDRVFSTGTYLDSLRFRAHLAARLDVGAASIDASVIGEHGTSSVFLWSSAQVGGVPLRDLLAQRGIDFNELRDGLEKEVRQANITIIEGIGASQYGIGMTAAKVAAAVLRDEGAVFPLSTYQPRFKTALSLPCVLGRSGITGTLWPAMTKEEAEALERSARTVVESVEKCGGSA